MTRYVCDRCGSVIIPPTKDRDEHFLRLTVRECWMVFPFENMRPHEYDLCTACSEDFNNWLTKENTT